MSSSEEVGVIHSVSREVRRFTPPPAAKKRALIDEAAYEQMYRRSVDDPQAFWAEQA
jgi:acetyl-CoA synthetase